MPKLKVLLTGAAGRIGRAVLKPLQAAYALSTFDRRPVPGDPDAVPGELEDLAAVKSAVQGVAVVVHLAANPAPHARFDELLGPNIIGMDNLLQAAVAAKVRRVVFASSCQAMLAYPEERRVEVSDPVRPITLYGTTKVYGEVLGRYYHDRNGLEFVGLRIGGFADYDHHALRDRWLRIIWLSPRDAVKIIRCAVERPGVKYVLAFATSSCDPEWLSLKTAREELGYEPGDDVRTLYPL